MQKKYVLKESVVTTFKSGIG